MNQPSQQRAAQRRQEARQGLAAALRARRESVRDFEANLDAVREAFTSAQDALVRIRDAGERVESALRSLGLYPDTQASRETPLAEVAGLRGVRSGLVEAPGIYFLVRDGALVYVGQSVNIANRLSGSHHVFEFGDRVLSVHAEFNVLNETEAAFIRHFRPLFNYDGNKLRVPCISPARDAEILKTYGVGA